MVDWIDSYCPDKPFPPHAHHWEKVISVDRGSIFMCRYCKQYQWWPASFAGAVVFREMIHAFGIDKAYQFLLEDHPTAKSMLSKLDALRAISRAVTDEADIAKIALAIDKEEL